MSAVSFASILVNLLAYLCLSFLIFFSIFFLPASFSFFFFNDTAPTEIYPLSLHDALPIYLDATGAAPPAFWSKLGFDGPDQPVVGLAWSEAVLFATWTSARLPTEAEWERAARGGVEDARFPWGDEPTASTVRGLPVVGATPANPLGLTDLSGVCHEGGADWFADDYYHRPPRKNPHGPATRSRRR